MVEVEDVLARRAREDAQAARRADEEHEPEPTRIQCFVAAAVSRILGVEVDPRSAEDLGYQHPYYVGEVTVAGITFTEKYRRDSNGLRSIAAPISARRRVKRWVFSSWETRAVRRIGDLDGWL